MLGLAASAARAASSGADPGAMMARMAPRSRMWRVRALVSTPSSTGMPCSVSQASREPDARQLECSRANSRNRFANPLPLDDVAVDFPDLKLIDAHCGRPLYTDTSFFLLRRHPNVYCDISSVPPKSIPQYYPWLERVADKAMFGSDWPGPGIRDIGDNIQQFLQLNFSDEIKRKILRENAVRVFGL